MKPRVCTGTCTVYYDRDGGPLYTVPLRGVSRNVGDGDQYVRTLDVGQDWRPLDLGHVEHCALMILVNEPDRYTVNPTADQRAASEAKIVELSFGLASPPPPNPAPGPRTMFSAPLSTSGKDAPAQRVDQLIHPGDYFRGTPVDLRTIRIRCRQGQARCTLYLFPE